MSNDKKDSMKKTALAILLTGVLSTGISCSKEEIQPGKIDILCQSENLKIDLNVADNPYVTCVIDAESGLECIEMFTVFKDGSSVPFKTAIRSFNTPTRHSIYERPVYSEDMAAFRIVATDRGGASESKEITLDITGLVTSPEVVFGQESIAFSEGDAIPQFSFRVTAKAELARIRIELIQSGSPMELIPDVESFESPMNFSFNSSEHFLSDYDLNRTPSAIRVTAYDSYGKIGQALLKIEYKALPSPDLTLKSIPSIEEYSSCTVSGSAASENGLVSADFYATGEKYEFFLGSRELGSVKNAEFSFEVDGMEMLEYVTGIKVVVKDARNKSTSITAPVTVIPRPLPVAADADLAELLQRMSSDDKYRSIKLLLAPGAEYNLGTSSFYITKTLKLEADPEKAMPTIKVGASYAFLTDNAVADEISLKGIHFNSEKSGSGMFNNSGGCSIGSIVVEDCLIDGSFSTTFLRSSGNSNIGSITLINNIIWWSNTSGTYSLFHLTQSSDKVSSLTIKDCTIGGAFYFMYNNTGNNSFSLEISNCSFLNQKGSTNGYFVSCSNGTLKGSITLKKNLFGGSNNIKGGYRILRANKLSVNESDNWCTKTWKSFSDDTANGSVNPIQILPDSEDNDSIFHDAASKDFSIKAGTSVYEKRIGDPRWIH